MLREDLRKQEGSGYAAYILIWLILLGLTVVTVTVSRLSLGSTGAVISLAIASLKAGLILLFFMHLRHEGRLLKGIFLIPIVLISLIIGFTFLDVWYR
ncbi:MAG: cytochrome C oxidase subunit IV family protein [Nitrospirae bacterium]|nr:cytochrome C oxidase subunit IV family protein [Nitrospirota bacterium]